MTCQNCGNKHHEKLSGRALCNRCYVWLTGTIQASGQKQGRMPKQSSTPSVKYAGGN